MISYEWERILNQLLPILSSKFTVVITHIVDLDLPLLLGLDAFTQLKATVDYADDLMASKNVFWCVNHERKLWHLYVIWDGEIFLTEPEVRKLHSHIYHPSGDKLKALINCKASSHEIWENRTAVSKVRSACDICIRNRQEPYRFRVSMPNDKCFFNSIAALDSMFINNRALPHWGDKDTNFNAAAFFKNETANRMWEVSSKFWSHVFIEYPDHIIVGQGPQFVSENFKRQFQVNGVKFQLSRVELHNAIGGEERYHAFLRKVYYRFSVSHHVLYPELTLQISIKVVNETAGPQVLASTLLVFEVIPRLPVDVHELPGQRTRFDEFAYAREVMTKIMALNRNKKILQSRAPITANCDTKLNNKVLLYCRRMKRWDDPCKVIFVEQEAQSWQ